MSKAAREIPKDLQIPAGESIRLNAAGTAFETFTAGVGTFTSEEAQDAVGTILVSSATVDLTYADGTPSITADAITQMSINSDASGLMLVGDEEAPGNTKLYGTDGSGNKGWYDQPSGGPGGGNSVTTTLAFGASFTDKAQTVVTGQTWVTTNSEIVAQVLTPSGTDPDEMRLLDLKPVISDLVAGTGFTVTLYSEPEAKGNYSVMCIGV